jgi:hypothetical protein
MSSLSDGIHLVDIDGNDVPVTEKDNVPFDPWDSPYWDVWHYEISDPTEVAALEAETDRHDAPSPGEARWLTLMWSESSGLPPISGGGPEPFSPSAEDWADDHGWSEDLDRRRRQVSDVELGMMSGGLAVG